jgi:antitoxin CcdA
MHTHSEQSLSKRRPVNLTIREDVLIEAKSKEWLETNKQALQAHNKRIAEEGTLLKPKWASE